MLIAQLPNNLFITQLPSGASFFPSFFGGLGSPLNSTNQKRMPILFSARASEIAVLSHGVLEVAVSKELTEDTCFAPWTWVTLKQKEDRFFLGLARKTKGKTILCHSRGSDSQIRPGEIPCDPSPCRTLPEPQPIALNHMALPGRRPHSFQLGKTHERVLNRKRPMASAVGKVGS